jgi:hypothetical protein
MGLAYVADFMTIGNTFKVIERAVEEMPKKEEALKIKTSTS